MQKTIRRQAEALDFARAFGANAYHVMVWAGPPGLSKTRTITGVLGKEEIVYLSGDVSPYQLYKDVYHNRQAGKIIIDDVETLIRQRLGPQLLKAFCQTEETKSVGWHKATKDLEKEGIPKEYETSARFCLICNDEDAIKKHLGPVIDRGVLVRFRYPATEVHRMVGEWLHVNNIDREVYDFIGDHLRFAKVPSARLYKTATDTKKANPGIDWREAVLETFGLDEDEVEVARLYSDPKYPSNAARWREFQRRGFGSRAKFYRVAGDMGLVGARAEGDVDEGVTSPVSSPAITPIAPSVIMEALGFGHPEVPGRTEPVNIPAEPDAEAGTASPDVPDTLEKDDRNRAARDASVSETAPSNDEPMAQGVETKDLGESLSIPRVAVRANVTAPKVRAHPRKGKIPAPIVGPQGCNEHGSATPEQVVACPSQLTTRASSGNTGRTLKQPGRGPAKHETGPPSRPVFFVRVDEQPRPRLLIEAAWAKIACDYAFERFGHAAREGRLTVGPWAGCIHKYKLIRLDRSGHVIRDERPSKVYAVSRLGHSCKSAYYVLAYSGDEAIAYVKAKHPGVEVKWNVVVYECGERCPDGLIDITGSAPGSMTRRFISSSESTCL